MHVLLLHILVRLIICLTSLRTGVDLVSSLGASVLTTSHFIACAIYVGVKCVRMSVYMACVVHDLCMIVIGVVDSFKGVSQPFGARMSCAY